MGRSVICFYDGEQTLTFTDSSASALQSGLLVPRHCKGPWEHRKKVALFCAGHLMQKHTHVHTHTHAHMYARTLARSHEHARSHAPMHIISNVMTHAKYAGKIGRQQRCNLYLMPCLSIFYRFMIKTLKTSNKHISFCSISQ